MRAPERCHQRQAAHAAQQVLCLERGVVGFAEANDLRDRLSWRLGKAGKERELHVGDRHDVTVAERRFFDPRLEFDPILVAQCF